MKLNLLKLSILLIGITQFFVVCAQLEKTTTLEQLNTNLQKISDASELPGFSIVLTDENSVLFQHSYGYADLKSKKPFSNYTVQNIGSVSKTFIAVALMKAVDLGLLKLDDNINKYLPFKVNNLYFPETAITLRHLANHTSGIIDDAKYDKAYSLIGVGKIEKEKYSADELEFLQTSLGNEIMDESQYLKDVLSSKGKWFSKQSFAKVIPGEKSIYTNIGATLAAYVLENASGMRYEDFLKENIFKPLNMPHTTFILDDIHRTDFVTRYFPNGVEVPNYNLITKADGAIITSTTDMSKYMQEMLKASHQKGTLLSDKSFIEMVKRQTIGEETSGIFWDIADNGDMSHAGADPGVFTYLYIKPNKNSAIFFMTNILAIQYPKAKKSFALVMHAIKNHQWN